MKTFITAYEIDKYNNALSGLFSIYFFLNVEYKNEKLLNKELKERWFSQIDRTLWIELNSNIDIVNSWF